MAAGVPVRGRWGSVPSGLVAVRLGDQTWNVAADQAGRFQGFLTDAQTDGLIPGGTITSSGGYNDRQISILGKPTGRRSEHADGRAIDLNAAANAQGSKVGSIVKDKALALARKWGLRWGGTFSTPDFMHFEVAKGAAPMPLGAGDITDRPANRTTAPTVAAPSSSTSSGVPTPNVEQVGWIAIPGIGLVPDPFDIGGKAKDAAGNFITDKLGLDGIWSNVSRIAIGAVLVAGGIGIVVLGAAKSVDAKLPTGPVPL